MNGRRRTMLRLAWRLARLYRLLRSNGRRPTLVSIGHRASLKPLHDCTLDLAAFRMPAAATRSPSAGLHAAPEA